MTIDEAITHAEEVAEEQEGLYRLCPASESDIFHCDGTEDCKTLKNGKNKGCQKCAAEHRQLAEWLKELKQLREQTRWIPCSEGLPKEKDAGILKKLGTSKRSEYVLATVEAKGERMTVTACTYDGKWNWDMKYAFPDYKVIAWMPLQEPYGGKKNGRDS